MLLCKHVSRYGLQTNGKKGGEGGVEEKKWEGEEGFNTEHYVLYS